MANSSSTDNPQLVHESEAQRQHIRIALPARVEIHGQSYTLHDWSVAGISIDISDRQPDSLNEHSTVEASLHFDFDGWALSLPVSLRILSHDSDRLRAEFTQMNRQQRALMQYMVSAYTSGELVNAGDLLDVAGRHHYAKPRNLPSQTEGMGAGQKLRHYGYIGFKSALLIALATALILYILTSIYERLYIIEATSAQVAAEPITVDAPAGGKLYYLPLAPKTRVEAGQPLFSITTANGVTHSADSPCDCLIAKRLKDNNRLIYQGEPALELIPPQTTPYIEAYIPQKQAAELNTGAIARLSLPSQKAPLRGKITLIEATKGLDGNARLRIEPTTALPPEAVGSPVKLRIDQRQWLR